jgi:FAD/FMN-containing dehydrogenase
VAATFATGAAAAAAVRAVLGAGFLPCALEVADAYTLQCAREHLGAKRVPAGRAFLLVELDGQPETVRAEALAVSRIVRACRAVSLRVAPDAESGEKLWALRREFSPALRVRGLDKLNEDIVVPRGRLVDLFRFAERLRREHGFPVACFGHAGDGNIHVNVMCDLSAPGVRRRVDTVLEALFRQVLEWGGAVTGEHGVGLAKRRWFGGAVGRPVLEAHHAIKRALDPHGVLNPGKFL